jgi:hypothetical protein
MDVISYPNVDQQGIHIQQFRSCEKMGSFMFDGWYQI